MGERGPSTEHLYRRDRVWWCWYYGHDGTRVRRSTGCTDKRAARIKLADWEQVAADPDADQGQTLNDCLHALLAERRDRTTKENIRFLSGKLTPIVTLLGHGLPIATIRNSSFAWRYIDERRRVFAGTRKRAAGDRTIRRELIVLRRALALAKSRGRWSGDPNVVVPPDFTVLPAPKGDILSRADAPRILARLSPVLAAATAFVLATGAEMSALRRALKADLPEDIEVCTKVLVRGTKNARRHAFVPVVTDEQRVLLDYARRHAAGPGEKLFGDLHRLIKALRITCTAEKITVVSPHDIRRSAGQWMVDIGVPIELVSKFMRHADTRVTERIYASIKEVDVSDRILQAIDPRYASAALLRPPKPLVETLKALPAPTVHIPIYEVDEVRGSLAEWSRRSGIAKPTLHHRVVTRGMSMTEALALGRAKYRPRQRATTDQRSSCDTGVTASGETSPASGSIPVAAVGRTLEKPLNSRVSQCARTDSNGRLSASKADALSS